jgi:hypothetical protein
MCIHMLTPAQVRAARSVKKRACLSKNHWRLDVGLARVCPYCCCCCCRCVTLLLPPDYSKLVFGPHAGPVVFLSVSPFLPELLLSVGDWTFRLWHHGLDSQVPLFVSPQAEDTYTAGGSVRHAMAPAILPCCGSVDDGSTR